MSHIAHQAKIRARKIRNEYSLGDAPISDICKFVEELGIYLFVRPFETSASAMFMRQRSTHMVILNSAHTLGHQYFSAAHELSHFFFDKDLTGAVCQTNQFNQDSDIEKSADFFASYFLMPEDGLLWSAERRNPTLALDASDVIYLQQQFNVSWSAMLYRLLNMGLITNNDLDNFRNIKIKREASLFGYDTALYNITNETKHSQRYIEKVIQALNADEISEAKANEYLFDIGTSIETLSSVTDAEGDHAF